ncbi:MAG: DUF192 domain-containing protein [Chloroflexi bacterium]|nr:DUF192 domain-containing protein [Chloroflexota bacterium]
MTVAADKAGAREGVIGVRAASGTLIAGRVRLATSFWARFRGLMGTPRLDADEGLFLPVNSIHMLFMRFPIDALFVDEPDAAGDRRIVAIRADLPAWRGVVMPVRGATGVLELAAGTAARSALLAGAVVRLAPSIGSTVQPTD